MVVRNSRNYALIYPLFAAGSLAVHKIKRQAFRFLNVLLVAKKKERQSSCRL
jgi:hypothetical protein